MDRWQKFVHWRLCGLVVTRATHRGIYDYAWAFDGKHLLYFSDENGNEDFHLYSVDLTNEEIRDLTPFAGTRAQQLLLSPVRPGQALVGINRRDRKVFDVYRVDLKTGATILDTLNPGDVLSWTADPNFVVRAATAFTDRLDTAWSVSEKTRPRRGVMCSCFRSNRHRSSVK